MIEKSATSRRAAGERDYLDLNHLSAPCRLHAMVAGRRRVAHWEIHVAAVWRQLTPRDALPRLDRMWWFHHVDDIPVWSTSHLYLRRGYRRRFEDRKAREGIGA